MNKEALRDEIWANQGKVLGRIVEIEADAIPVLVVVISIGVKPAASRTVSSSGTVYSRACR